MQISTEDVKTLSTILSAIEKGWVVEIDAGGKHEDFVVDSVGTDCLYVTPAKDGERIEGGTRVAIDFVDIDRIHVY